MIRSIASKIFIHTVLPFFWLVQCTYLAFPELDQKVSKLAVLGGLFGIHAIAYIILSQFGYFDWYLKPAHDGKKIVIAKAMAFSFSGFLIGAAVCVASRIGMERLWPDFSHSVAGKIFYIFQIFSVGMGFYLGLILSGFTGIYNRAAETSAS